MKVELQGKSECLLAVMAALRGVPLESVRKRACEIACTDRWESIIGSGKIIKINGQNRSIFWATIDILAAEMSLNPTDFMVSLDDLIEVTSEDSSPFVLPIGKGIVNIQITRLFNITYHICVFENGRLYDSGAWSNPSVTITGETPLEFVKRWEEDGNTIRICDIKSLDI